MRLNAEGWEKVGELANAKLTTLQTIFHLCIPKKDLAKPNHLISTKYF